MLKLDAEIEKSSLKEVTLQNNETLLAVGFWMPASPKLICCCLMGLVKKFVEV